MRDYDEEIVAYEDDAEDRYDDYDNEYYDDEDDFDSGFDGHEDEDGYDDDYEEEMEYVEDYEDEEDDNYDSYKTSSIGKIDPNDRTLTFVVKNTTDADAEAVLFGGNQMLTPPAGVTITCEESSHSEVQHESRSNPFSIAGMKMSVTDPLQFDNVLRVTRRTATGSNTTRVYQPRNASSPQNFTSQMIDDHSFACDVTGQDSIRFTIKQNTTVVFTFTIKARANMGNLLKGNNVAEMSHSPRTTGLPQIDLLRQKKPRALGMRPKPPKRRVKRVVRRRPSPSRRRPTRRPSRSRYLRRRR